MLDNNLERFTLPAMAELLELFTILLRRKFQAKPLANNFYLKLGDTVSEEAIKLLR